MNVKNIASQTQYNIMLSPSVPLYSYLANVQINVIIIIINM